MKNCFRISSKQKQTINRGHPIKIRITVSKETTKQISEKEAKAKRIGDYRLLRRIAIMRMVEAGLAIASIALMMGLAEQTVRNWIHSFLSKGVSSLAYKKPPGRPARLTKTQKQELKEMILAGPEEAGYASACWTSLMVQELIQKKFGKGYSRFYVCELLGHLGFSYQKARFVSDHLNEEARVTWLSETWPQILAEAKVKDALILFGDEATCAMWGSLGRTWAWRGQQPEVKTSGKRKGYKLFISIATLTPNPCTNPHGRPLHPFPLPSSRPPHTKYPNNLSSNCIQ